MMELAKHERLPMNGVAGWEAEARRRGGQPICLISVVGPLEAPADVILACPGNVTVGELRALLAAILEQSA